MLKNMPAGTHLWSPAFGNVLLDKIDEDDKDPIGIKFYNRALYEWERDGLSREGRFEDFDGAECILFPSKNMRDWSKFAWKKGDVLHAGGEKFIVFDHWDKSDYSRIFGKYRYDKSDDEVIRDVQIHTSKCEKVDAITAALAVASIQTHLGGNLNLQTLETERPQKCQFKPFDKVLARDVDGDKWQIDLFEQYDRLMLRPYCCMTGSYRQCIPYEGNEHLLGTTDSPTDKEAAQ